MLRTQPARQSDSAQGFGEEEVAEHRRAVHAFGAAYCAAKSAIVGLTKAMAVDHSPAGVRVNCICPGTVETR